MKDVPGGLAINFLSLTNLSKGSEGEEIELCFLLRDFAASDIEYSSTLFANCLRGDPPKLVDPPRAITVVLLSCLGEINPWGVDRNPVLENQNFPDLQIQYLNLKHRRDLHIPPGLANQFQRN